MVLCSNLVVGPHKMAADSIENIAAASNSDAILVDELVCDGGKKVGLLTLNVPSTLNSLTLEMVDILQLKLDQWSSDSAIAAVLIDGSGEKAFCAGGDVQALHKSAVETPGGPCVYAEAFFEREYRMNFTLHNYAKPLICWGHGIVMGGGLGIFAGCSHRVVTERTRFAMPEVTIALFPDVGGSYFLNKMPGHMGRFLALTAANFNGRDGIDIGFASHLLSNSALSDLQDGLRALNWQADAEKNHNLAGQLLNDLAAQGDCDAPAGQLASRQNELNSLFSGTITEVVQRVRAINTEDEYLVKASKGLLHGSPLAVLWIDRQLELAKNMGLAEVFQSELQLGTNIVRDPEFAEGVRALLIDKDRQPKWQFASIEDVPSERLDGFFDSPWPQNPLHSL